MTLSAVMCLHLQDDILWLRSFEQSEAKSGAEAEAEAPPKDRHCWEAHVGVGVAPGRPGKATGEMSAWTFLTQYDDVSAGFITVSVAWAERTSCYPCHDWGWRRNTDFTLHLWAAWGYGGDVLKCRFLSSPSQWLSPSSDGEAWG